MVRVGANLTLFPEVEKEAIDFLLILLLLLLLPWRGRQRDVLYPDVSHGGIRVGSLRIFG
jgi:hypothetical protein